MFKSIFNKLKGDRKYFTIVFFILVVIFISGIITPLLIQQERNNWDHYLSKKISSIETSVNSLYEKKEDKVLITSSEIKSKLSHTLKPGVNSFGQLITLVNSDDYQDYSVEVFAPNGKLIAWNESVAISQEDIFPLERPMGETYFYRNNLITYLTVVDTLLIENDQFFYAVSLPIEKHFELQNPYFIELSFTKELSEKFLTQFQISYNPFTAKSKDGRVYSFELLNNKDNKIGIVNFFKPSLEISVNDLRENTNTIQSILVIVAFIFLGMGFRYDYKKIKYRLLKLVLIIFYFSLFRAVLFFVEFPSNIMDGSLSDPAYFSSAFGGGIVKSPIEFFVTAIFLLIISFNAYRLLVDYINNEPIRIKNKYLLALVIIPVSILFFLTLRGFSASIKSIIFDSTLRYFKDPRLLPKLPGMLMDLNILILGAGVLFFLLCFLIILLSLSLNENVKGKYVRRYYLSLFIIIQFLGIAFLIVQREPLITPLLSILFISLIFLLLYKIYFININSAYNYIYISLAASIISITLLNYFNLQLEREALKTTAIEVNRPNDNLFRFLVTDILTSSANNQNIIEQFGKSNSNFDAAAFIIWSGSTLQKESLNSLVTIYDNQQKLIGKFDVGINNDFSPVEYFDKINSSEPTIKEISANGNQEQKIYCGIIPVKDRDHIVGYISASILFDIQNLGAENIPDFIESKKNIVNSVVNLRLLKIFDFENSKLKDVYGDIYPSREQSEPILKAKFSDDNDAWLNLTLNNENYLTYILKTQQDNREKITSVSLRSKRLTWNLFNFFKLFIIHSIFITGLSLIILLFTFKNIKYTFRSRLLFSFLFISIIPVIILAVYNREIVEQRSEQAILNELNERVQYLENHVNEQLQKYKDRSYEDIFANAGKELGISFGVYDGTNQIFNSKSEYYTSGLFTSKLNPEAYYQLSYLSYREYFTREKIESYTYNAFYKKLNIGDKQFIVGVNDAFNKVRLTFSTLDIDVFLFGVYSFAAIIIIIISSLLSNKISDPIRRLTKATESVAQGDLNVYIQNKEKGEIKDLLDGFNSMTKELQKNQIELAELERENAWKEMAKQVAHEIKNPLTPMKLNIQQLVIAYKDKNKNFASIFDKVSNTILNQIENLSLIASEFSRFAKMPSLKLEEVDLVSSVHDISNLFSDEKINIELETKLNSALVEADKNQFKRMLINMFRNSVQANASIIKVVINENHENFDLLLIDNGKGIPDDVQSKIFDSNFTTKEKGMGIGLKLTKRFIEGINGNLYLLNSDSNGTTFKITIPKMSR